MCNAISLAVASHISLEQIRRGQISHWKGCALANASRNAVFCALLAAKGMTGPEEAFEGKAGFLASTGIRFEITPFADSADEYRIMKARVKAFPAGYFSQSAIEAILNLRPQIPNLDDIKEIRLQTFPAGYEVMPCIYAFSVRLLVSGNFSSTSPRVTRTFCGTPNDSLKLLISE